VDLTVLKRTIRLLIECGVDYEFRTTLVPGLVAPGDFASIGAELKGARLHVLQQFYPEGAAAADYRKGKPYTGEQAKAMTQELAPFVAEVKLRGKFL
jgi:pyruvate formate lyase activating enzyme